MVKPEKKEESETGRSLLSDPGWVTLTHDTSLQAVKSMSASRKVGAEREWNGTEEEEGEEEEGCYAECP